MNKTPPIPAVDVAVAVIRRSGKVLMCLNPKWAAFTLPMTKRRSWQDPNIPKAHREEKWLDAAARAACECLGRSFTVEPILRAELPEFFQSDREGIWKRYGFQVYEIPWSEGEEVRSNVAVEWLTPREILDESRRPISETARHIIARLQEQQCFE